MKRMIIFAALGMFFYNNNLSAVDILRNCCVEFGQSIQNIDVPVIGKLTNLLPVALIATSFKDYPGQTMLVCTGLLFYVLSKNELACSTFNKYKDIILVRLGINRSHKITSNDTLFIFDGDDEDDAEELVDIEDELLADDEWFGDRDKKVADQQKHVVKFL